MGGVVLRHLGADGHALHLHLVHLDGGRVARRKPLFEEGQQLVGVAAALGQQGLFAVEAHEVKAQQLGLEQHVAARGGVLPVDGLAAHPVGLVACAVERGEVEALRHDQLGGGHAVHVGHEEGAVLHGEVAQAVGRARFELGGLGVALQGLEDFVVLPDRLQHLVNALRPRRQRQQEEGGYPFYLQHLVHLLFDYLRLTIFII